MTLASVVCHCNNSVCCRVKCVVCCKSLCARECCRICQPHILAECHKRRLNQRSFVLLYFVLRIYSLTPKILNELLFRRPKIGELPAVGLLNESYLSSQKCSFFACVLECALMCCNVSSISTVSYNPSLHCRRGLTDVGMSAE